MVGLIGGWWSVGWPTIETFKRPQNLSDKKNPEVLYARAYLRVRLAIGALGISLPFLLLWAEGPWLRGDWRIRGSFSAYYHHSSARDIFVSVLVVVGFLLITYVAGQLWSWEFLLSAFSGVMAIGVAFFPTLRPGVLDENGELREGVPLCGDAPGLPLGCTATQERYGELIVGSWHGWFAILFIGGLAAICFLAAFRELKHRREREEESNGRLRLPMLAVGFHLLCGAFMVAGGLWFQFGPPFSIGSHTVTPVYAAEFVSVFAFGASWSLRGFDLVRQTIAELAGYVRGWFLRGQARLKR